MKIHKVKNPGRWALSRVQKYFPKVKTVSDSTESMHVSVSSVDAMKSKMGNFSECALAVACRRQLKADGAIIGLTFSYIIKGTHATRFSTPNSVAREMTSFDRHGDFDPGEYRLSKVGQQSRLGHTRKMGTTSTIRTGKTNNNTKVHYTARVRREITK